MWPENHPPLAPWPAAPALQVAPASIDAPASPCGLRQGPLVGAFSRLLQPHGGHAVTGSANMGVLLVLNR
jgi:hypothetical protein